MIRLLIVITLFIISCDYPREYSSEQSSPEEIYGIEIMLPSATICISEVMQAELLIILPSGEKKSAAPGEVLWANNGTTFFSVEESGLITGLSIGTGTLTARLYTFSAIKTVTIERNTDYSKILLSEIFYDIAGTDGGNEYIELYNGNDYQCDLSGFMIIDGDTDSQPFIIPEGSEIDAFDHIIFAQSHEGFTMQFGFPPDHSGFSFNLNNSGETVSFLRPDGEILDQVFIEGGYTTSPATPLWGSFEYPQASTGDAVHRIDSVDTDTFEDWSDGPPSPGEN